MDETTSEIWDELAPLAVQQGTLTPATAYAFGWVCRTVGFERKLAAAPLTVGSPDHCRMMQRMEVGLARFRLIPDGKPTAQPETPKDEFAEFDGPTVVRRA